MNKIEHYYKNGTTSFLQDELIKNEINQTKLQYNAFKEQKYSELLRENEQLKDNWNKLKEWLKSNIKHWEEQEEKWDELGIIEVDRKSNIKIIFKMLLDIMQDLERSDSNV